MWKVTEHLGRAVARIGRSDWEAARPDIKVEPMPVESKDLCRIAAGALAPQRPRVDDKPGATSFRVVEPEGRQVKRVEEHLEDRVEWLE